MINGNKVPTEGVNRINIIRKDPDKSGDDLFFHCNVMCCNTLLCNVINCSVV